MAVFTLKIPGTSKEFAFVYGLCFWSARTATETLKTALFPGQGYLLLCPCHPEGANATEGSCYL